jgi:hypothetical protein
MTTLVELATPGSMRIPKIDLSYDCHTSKMIDHCGAAILISHPGLGATAEIERTTEHDESLESDNAARRGVARSDLFWCNDRD